MPEADQPSDRSDTKSDDVKPWTIKGIPPEERNAAIAAADRDGQTIGEWMRRAIRAQVQSDRQADRAPVPVGPEPDPKSDLEDIERLLGLAATLAQVSGGTAPKSVSNTGFSLIRERLRAIRRADRAVKNGRTAEAL